MIALCWQAVDPKVAIPQQHVTLLDGQLLLRRKCQLHQTLSDDPFQEPWRPSRLRCGVGSASRTDTEHSYIVELACEPAHCLRDRNQIRRIGHKPAVYEDAAANPVRWEVGRRGSRRQKRIAQRHVYGAFCAQSLRQQYLGRTAIHVDCANDQRLPIFDRGDSAFAPSTVSITLRSGGCE